MAMNVVAQELVDELGDVNVITLNWVIEMLKRKREFLKSSQRDTRAGEHAGEGETSRMLSIHPELVHMDRARDFTIESGMRMESMEHPLNGGGVFRATRDWRRGAPFGLLGVPTKAAAETGHSIYEVSGEWMAEVISREFHVSRPAEARA